MPDDFDSLQEDQGTGTGDILDPSTVADEGAQDLQGLDAAQSPEDDLGGTPAPEEEDSHPSGDFLDEADLNLLRFDPERGIERIQSKANDFLKNQNKAFTRRMSKVAKDYKPAQQKAQSYDNLEAAMGVINQTDPEWVKSALARLKAAAEGKYGEWGKTVNPNSSDTPLRSKDDLVGLIRSTVQEAVGTLRNEYTGDKASGRVDAVLAQVKNDRLSAHRDALIKTLAANPAWSMSQALGAIDPDLLVSIKQGSRPAAPVQRELSSFTTKPGNKYSTFDDAFDAAFAKHGDPDRMRE
jgi:hypothetical protein